LKISSQTIATLDDASVMLNFLSVAAVSEDTGVRDEGAHQLVGGLQLKLVIRSFSRGAPVFLNASRPGRFAVASFTVFSKVSEFICEFGCVLYAQDAGTNHQSMTKRLIMSNPTEPKQQQYG